VSMGFKLTVVRALKDQLEDAEAAYGQAASLMEQMSIDVDRLRIELLQRTARAVLTLKQAGSESGRAAIEEILRDLYSADLRSQERIRSELLELYLFNAELLIADTLHAEQAAGTVQGVDFLALLLSRFPGIVELAPYLRRYYEVAVEASIPTDTARAAHLVLHSRQLSRRAGSVTVVFFLQDYRVKKRHNVAWILLPGGECEAYPLPFGRYELRHPATRISPLELPLELREHLEDVGASIETWDLRLPEELVSRILELQDGENIFRIVWDDSICWPIGSSEAFTDDGWPFGAQLDLRALTAPWKP
jgi:hypothetical protein